MRYHGAPSRRAPVTLKRTTTAAELLLRIGRRTAVPLRLQLERRLRHAVQSGGQAAGSPLPSTRAFAADLGLSRGVMVEAYEQLLAEGYFTATHGSATRVAARRTAPDTRPSFVPVTAMPRFDLRPGLPDLSLFPLRAGLSSIRRALAGYLNRARATMVAPERLPFCSGSSQAIALVCRVLRDRGVRALAVVDPGHGGSAPCRKRYGR